MCASAPAAVTRPLPWKTAYACGWLRSCTETITRGSRRMLSGFASSLSGVEQQLVTLDVHPNHSELGVAFGVERLVVIVEYHIGANQQLRVRRESGFSCSVYCHASSPLASEAPFPSGSGPACFLSAISTGPSATAQLDSVSKDSGCH